MTNNNPILSPVTFDPASMRDLNDIMPVMNAAFEPEHGEAWTLPQCSGIMSLPGSWLYVARSETTLVGFAMGRTILSEAELLLIAVAPCAQRTGVGDGLMNMLIAALRENGVAKLHLEVRSNNMARAFYEEFGFSEVGLRKNYYRGANGALTDALTLSRDIQ